MATPLLDIDTQHVEMIHDAQLDYYAKRLATCSSDTTVKVYDIQGDQQYQFLADLKGHDGPVWEVSWAHPKFGVVLASCSYDGKVIIHREQPAGQWQQIFVYQEVKASMNSLAWAPHEFDLCLACVASDGTLVILQHNTNDNWSANKLDTVSTGLNAVSWAPYGASSSKERRLVTGGCDNLVRIWVFDENMQGREEQVLQENIHTDWVRDVAWAPSIGLPCNTIASCSEDGKVVVWTQSENGAPWTSCVVREKSGTPAWRVSWSMTGSVLAISSGDSEVTLWKEAADGHWVQISNLNEAAAAPPAPQGYEQRPEDMHQTPELQPQQQQQQQHQPQQGFTAPTQQPSQPMQQQAMGGHMMPPAQQQPIQQQPMPMGQPDYGQSQQYGGPQGGMYQHQQQQPMPMPPQSSQSQPPMMGQSGGYSQTSAPPMSNAGYGQMPPPQPPMGGGYNQAPPPQGGQGQFGGYSQAPPQGGNMYSGYRQ